jgi:hypothetical protein
VLWCRGAGSEAVHDQHGLEVETEVTDSGEQPVQLRLVNQRADQLCGAPAMRHLHAIEAGRDPVTECAADGDVEDVVCGAVLGHD